MLDGYSRFAQSSHRGPAAYRLRGKLAAMNMEEADLGAAYKQAQPACR